MSLSIESSVPPITKSIVDFESDLAKQATSAATKPEVSASKPAAEPDEAAQIKLLAQLGHSNQQIAALTGLAESLVALTLGDSTVSTSSTSSASALVAPSGHLSLFA